MFAMVVAISSVMSGNTHAASLVEEINGLIDIHSRIKAAEADAQAAREAAAASLGTYGIPNFR